MLDKRLKKELIQILGKEFFSDKLEDRVCYSFDATGKECIPLAVLKPAHAYQISQILKLANRHKIPIFPRGAGTGFSGGSIPAENGLALVLTRLNRIIEVDEENFTATLEPGVITGKFQEYIEKKGLFYPPDPASLKFSTIGGNVAENSGGPRAVKYGVTRDYLLGLEIVLPTGEIMDTGSHTIKSVVGYDLTRLICGSEGTLAVITKIRVRLLPLPESVRTALAFFKTAPEAALAVQNMHHAGIIPRTIEFIDAFCLECVKDEIDLDIPRQSSALLLEVDGDSESTLRHISTIEKVCQQTGAISFSVAGDAQAADKLWQARRAVSPALGKLGDTKLNEDICVPRAHLAEMVLALEKLAQEEDLIIASFGHAGDGNLHVNIMYNEAEKDKAERAEKAVRKIYEETLKLNGSISGEHGIGLSKAPFIEMETGSTALLLMKKIKKVFDPNNILNPGKMFPVE